MLLSFKRNTGKGKKLTTLFSFFDIDPVFGHSFPNPAC